MLAHNVGAILIIDQENKLLGILSERDLLRRVAGQHERYAELPVAQFMTANPETVTAEDTLAFAVHKMDVGGYRHLPVLTDGKPSGVISVRDMLDYIIKLCSDG
jgi:CBS domain-containing protein